MNPSQASAKTPMVAIPRNPTAEDVRTYVEFLVERHPLILEAVGHASERLAERGVDLQARLLPDVG
jgi:hypothetical protein